MQSIKKENKKSISNTTDITVSLLKSGRNQSQSNYLNSTFEKIRPNIFFPRKNSFQARVKRTESYSEGINFKIKRIVYSVPSHHQHSRKAKVSSSLEDTKSKNSRSLIQDSKHKQFLTETKKTETHHKHTCQSGLSFSSSEIFSGSQPSLEECLTVNKIVRRQFQPILYYQFSKLSRKDIIPSISHNLKQSVTEKLRKRMEANLQKNRIVVYSLDNKRAKKTK